jgi:hypothetical protein
MPIAASFGQALHDAKFKDNHNQTTRAGRNVCRVAW